MLISSRPCVPLALLNECYSYDLELDKKLAEETTVLSESYTVRANSKLLCRDYAADITLHSYLTDARSELVPSATKLPSVCSSQVW